MLQINQSEVDDDRIKFPLLAELNQVLQMEPETVQNKATDKVVIIDVREKSEFHGELGHIAGSRLVSLAKIPATLDDLDSIRAA